MAKTADYTRKAIDKYRNQYDFISLRFPKGTKERLENLGIANSDLVDACLQFIDGVAETVESDAQNVKEASETEHMKTPEKPKAESLDDLQALLDEKRADIEAKKQEKEAHKEQKRAETIAAAKFAENANS